MNLNNKYLINNSIYKGRVFHFREKPKKHSFKYKVFYIYFDILKMNSIFKKIPFFSIEKFNLFSFYFSDHGPKNNKNLIFWIKNIIKKNFPDTKVSSIFLLTHPRVFGYVFNPLSIYTCFDNQKNIVAQIYEVHNTFRQRHFYLVKNTFDKKLHSLKVKKAFHVSPFMGMTGTYNFKSYSKREKLSILIKYQSKNENFIASFTGRSLQLNNRNLFKEFLLLPFMTLKIIIGIHFEAIFLYLKGLKFYKCPKQKRGNVTN